MAYSDQMGSLWTRATRVLGSLLLVTAGVGVNAAEPCAISAKPWLSLTITPGLAVTASDRIISVRVHDNGCAEIHRPSFYRDAGDHRLLLQPAEIDMLRAGIDAKQLAAFDSGRVQRKLAAAQASGGKSQTGAAENFTVLDADYYQIELHTGELHVGKKSAAAAWPGVHDYAEFYPEIVELKQLSTMVLAVQALLEREDALRVQGAIP
jgi:hypothetical protein